MVVVSESIPRALRDRWEVIVPQVRSSCGSVSGISLKGKGENVLDFGCGGGIATLRAAIESPGTVYGVDITNAHRGLSESAKKMGVDILPKNLVLSTIPMSPPYDFADDQFDLIYSWSVFEHINSDVLPLIAKELYRTLSPTGRMVVQVDPLYFSARGAHLYSVLKEPWVHLLEQHDTLRERFFAASQLSKERTEFYWESYRQLNRITSFELIQLFVDAGFSIVSHQISRDDLIPPKKLLLRHNADALMERSIILVLSRDGREHSVKWPPESIDVKKNSDTKVSCVNRTRVKVAGLLHKIARRMEP